LHAILTSALILSATATWAQSPAEEPADTQEAAPVAEEPADTQEAAPVAEEPADTEETATAAEPAPAPPAEVEEPEEEPLPDPAIFEPEQGATPVPAEPAAFEQATPVDVEAAPSSEELHKLEARALEFMALDLVLERQWEDARALFARLEEGYDDTAEGLRASAYMRTIDKLTRGGPSPYVAVPKGDGFEIVDPDTGRTVDLETEIPRDEPVNGGRRELMVTQAAVGAGLIGVGLPVILELPTPPVVLLGLGAGGAGGALTAGAITERYPVTRGQAMAIGTGELLGGWNATVAVVALGMDEPWQVVLPIMGGTVLGGVAGTQAAIYGQPDPGQVAMVTHGSLWGLYAGSVSFLVFPHDNQTASVIRLGAATDLGALAGAALASQFPASRRRVNLVSLTGMGGATLGAGLSAALAERGVYSETAQAALMLVGGAGGLAAGSFFTRNLDTQSGLTRGSFHPGTPTPWFGHDPEGEPLIGLALAGGQF